ncbi:uncharacterized protein F5Z01DRAFT_629404 [Emericellopsis atlantica]|uniref:Zn(2)-C6 fungal-type domain-containing protein n=1 Tax=Emericellopsis atlantica TaxID=2614577 RepID=A0A9P7ZEP8_9HYPO|nr:uncharacterized protein F5Z01DRAFT_629404 [Emericellopsis atlantica]KAG9250447.1 hypothetical protein F5Z01DRAFT_629404 [Emericellopsis atlantica]
MTDEALPDQEIAIPDRAGTRQLIKCRPIPRKGHRKSRAGCFTCKRRKVKCNEAIPECGQCRRLELDCQYESTPRSQPREADWTLGRPLSATPSTFQMQDLRFFQHFLLTAYPTLPPQGDETWQGVGQMSHQYDFLVHAMLGLGASHLGMLDEQGYRESALMHRIKAIKLMNKFLSRRDPPTVPNRDAALGTILCLTYQSAYIADGMTDFLIMIRGCYILGPDMGGDWSTSLFNGFVRKTYVNTVTELMPPRQQPEPLDEAVLKGFLASARRVATLCQSLAEMEVLALVQEIAMPAATDLAHCYLLHSYLYEKLAQLTTDEFNSFIDPQNHVSRLVIMHMLTVVFVISRKEVGAASADHRSTATDGKGVYACRKSMAVQWVQKMISELADEYRPYSLWLESFVNGLSFSFTKRDEIWKPFLLHNGTTIVAKFEGLGLG